MEDKENFFRIFNFILLNLLYTELFKSPAISVQLNNLIAFLPIAILNLSTSPLIRPRKPVKIGDRRALVSLTFKR